MSKKGTKVSKPFEFNRKSIILLIVISLAGILTGVFVGGFFIGVDVPEYGSYDEASLRDDVEKLSNDAQGRSPSRYKPYEIFEIAEYRLFTHGSVLVNTEGAVATIANQRIAGIKAYENGVFFKENISAGIKNVGERTYFTEGTDTLTCYEASSVKDMVASYKSPTTRTYDEYCEINGVPIDSFVAYIVSSKTVLNQDAQAERITLENGETGYQFVLQLHPIYSVLNYVYQMQNLSQLPSLPAFADVTLTVVVDEEFRFISVETLEHYTVNYMGINASCTGTLTEKFQYGLTNIIPETVVA